MSIFGRLFGSQKVVEENAKTVVDGVVNGLDAIVFTKEEQAHFHQGMMNWVLKYMQATQPQNLARRLIAFVIVGLWAFVVLLASLAWKWDKAYSDFLFKVLSDVINYPFMMVMGFYFATHLARAWNNKGKENK